MNNWQLSFIAGCTFSLFLPSMPDIFWFFTAFLLLCCGIYTKRKNLAAFSLGCHYLLLYFTLLVKWDLPEDSHLRSSVIRGEVISSSQNFSCGSFTLSVTASQPFPTPLLSPSVRVHHQQADICPQVGQVLTLQVKLKPVHWVLNESVTDFPNIEYFNRQLVNATLQRVLESHPAQDSQRRELLAETKIPLSQLAHAGVIRALMFGDRSLLTPDVRQILRDHGISHLLAISGLHIGLVFALIFGLMRFICSRCWVLPWWQATFYPLLTAFVGAFCYSYLAGFAVSTVRAIAMLGFACLLTLNARRLSGFAIVNRVNFAVIVIYPLSVFSIAYWLSFGAVYCILVTNWLLPSRKTETSFLKSASFWFVQLAKLQLCLFVGILPFSLLFFDGVALNGLLSNLIAIPFVSFLVIPLVLIALLCWLLGVNAVSVVLWEWADCLIDVLLQILLQLQWLEWWSVSPTTTTVIGAVLLAPLLLVKPLRIPCVLLLVMVLAKFWVIRWQDENTLQLHVLEVGQGSALVLQRGSEAIIYDVGPAYPPFYNSAKAVILPWLKGKGITDIHALILSHGDNDHSGAAPYLLSQRPIGRIYINRDMRNNDQWLTQLNNSIRFNKTVASIQACESISLHWKSVIFTSLQAQKAYQRRNDNSCVIKVEFEEFTVLLPGDIGKSVELDLVKKYQEDLQADILIAPHHGSKSSSSWSFINRVNAEHVVFTTGFKNRFQFPKPAVVNRYQRAGSRLWETGKDGQISFTLAKNHPISVEAARRTFFSYWVYQ